MRSLLISLLVIGALAAQRPADPCATGEMPCDPDRPWIRGTIEKSCLRPEALEAAREAQPGRIILACRCEHRCDPTDPHAGMTSGRQWDGRCEARCSPKNCGCPNPCTVDP